LNRSEKLALLGTLMCLPLTSCSRVSAKTNAETDAVPVRVVHALSQDIPLEVPAVGNVEPMNSVEVRARIAGQIKRVVFEEGQSVVKGQLLFTMDQDALQRQAAEQQAQLERDAAMEQQARAVVARDAASQKQNQSDAEIAVQLGTLGVLAQQRVNQLVTANESSRASVGSDKAAVMAATRAIQADRARLGQTQLQLSFANVVAPITGRAGAAMVKAGNMVREKDTTLVTVVQLSPVHVTFGIPEQVLPEVQRLNAQEVLTVEASIGDGAPLEGRLDFIDNTVDATTGTIRLKAVFSNIDKALWPGQFVGVRLRLRTEKDRTLVSDSAIQNGLDGKYVWLVKNGIANMTPVTVLRTYKPAKGQEQAVIGSGIGPGDVVVSEGQLRLTPGARVTLLNSLPMLSSQPSTAETKPAP
jgi:multidrug efflux system membrane fusion protein